MLLIAIPQIGNAQVSGYMGKRLLFYGSGNVSFSALQYQLYEGDFFSEYDVRNVLELSYIFKDHWSGGVSYTSYSMGLYLNGTSPLGDRSFIETLLKGTAWGVNCKWNEQLAPLGIYQILELLYLKSSLSNPTDWIPNPTFVEGQTFKSIAGTYRFGIEKVVGNILVLRTGYELGLVFNGLGQNTGGQSTEIEDHVQRRLLDRFRFSMQFGLGILIR